MAKRRTAPMVVESVHDGDTLRLAPPHDEAIRFLNIDSPELGGDTQEPWAQEARDHLRALLPPGTVITFHPSAEGQDQHGRLLGHVVRAGDDLHTNLEQVRLGYASTYFIWPNVAQFEAFRAAQIEAQQAGRGIWAPERPLRELPFEYRLRQHDRSPDKFVGDWVTRQYVSPRDYARISVHNRVFFFSEDDARKAGYRKRKEEAR